MPFLDLSRETQILACLVDRMLSLRALYRSWNQMLTFCCSSSQLLFIRVKKSIPEKLKLSTCFKGERSIWAEALKGPDESLLSFLFATESQVPSRGCVYSVDSGIILQSPSGPVAAAPDRQCAQTRLLWLKTTVVIPPTFYLEKFENKVERGGPSAPHLASPIGNILPHLLPFSCSLSMLTGLFESYLQVWRYCIPKYFNIIS